MAKKSKRSGPDAATTGNSIDGFPETRTDVLADAAAGEWGPFLEEYLRPCFKEVVIACRSRGMPLSDSDDLYQELMVRLLRDGSFGKEVRDVLAQEDEDPSFHGNLPARYLKSRTLPLRSARFRSYLKQTIRNLVTDALRKGRRRPGPLPLYELRDVEPWIDQSISRSLEGRWAAQSLAKAARQLRDESARARTAGRRRLFEILYFSAVRGYSAERIAQHFGVHRSTIADLLTKSRTRLVVLLEEITGITESSELKELLAGHVDELRIALIEAHQDRS